MATGMVFTAGWAADALYGSSIPMIVVKCQHHMKPRAFKSQPGTLRFTVPAQRRQPYVVPLQWRFP